MKATKKTNLLLVAMLLLHSVWLLTKDNIGNVTEWKTPIALVCFNILAGIMIILWPYLVKKKQSYFARIQHFIEDEKWNKHSFLILASVFFLLLVDLIFIPLVDLGVDETAMLSGVQIIVENSGRYFFDNYSEMRWLGAQHPPLPFLIIGYIHKLLGGDLSFTSRIITCLLGIAIAACTFFIARKLYDRKTAFYAVFLLFGIRRFYLSNVISNNDIFVAFFFTLSILLLLQLNKHPRSKKIFPLLGYAALAGLSIGLGGVSKYTMFLIGSLVPLMLLWPFPNRLPYISTPSNFWSNFRSGMPLLMLVFLSSLPALVSWFLFLYQSDVYQEQLTQISGYLGTEVGFEAGEMEVEKVQYLNTWRIKFILMAIFARIPAGIGPYAIPIIGLGIWRWIVDEKRGGKKQIWSNRFVFIWIAAVFIPVLITLPVDRYFMPAFPALAIMMAYGLNFPDINPNRIVLLAVILSISSATINF